METTKYYVAYVSEAGFIIYHDKKVKVNKLIFEELLRCQVKEITETKPEKFDEVLELVRTNIKLQPLIVGNIQFEIKEKS